MRFSLPMYDLPELRWATDAWAAGLAGALRAEGFALRDDRPERQGAREAVWQAPDLVLTQTCGFPLRHGMAGILSAVAAPTYRAPGGTPGRYSSAILVREDDAARRFEDCRGYRVAANGPDSQSGANCLRALAAPLVRDGAFFGAVRWSGAHRDSLALVAGGEADLCAVDCVTLALIAAVAPAEIAGLRRLCWSASAPTLPYAVPAGMPATARTRVRRALAAAIADPALAEAREALLLADLSPVGDDDYDAIVAMRRSADEAGLTALT